MVTDVSIFYFTLQKLIFDGPSSLCSILIYVFCDKFYALKDVLLHALLINPLLIKKRK
jgi:hypothetical protein